MQQARPKERKKKKTAAVDPAHLEASWRAFYATGPGLHPQLQCEQATAKQMEIERRAEDQLRQQHVQEQVAAAAAALPPVGTVGINKELPSVGRRVAANGSQFDLMQDSDEG